MTSNQIGSGSGQAIATAAGAVIGMVFFGNLGRQLDEHARMKAEAARVQALDTGRVGDVIRWDAPNAGGNGGTARGEIEIVQSGMDSGGRPCREYVHTVLIGGKETEVRGIACRDAAGEWVDAGQG